MENQLLISDEKIERARIRGLWISRFGVALTLIAMAGGLSDGGLTGVWLWLTSTSLFFHSVGLMLNRKRRVAV